jgi:hypothetical protein
MRGLGAWLLRRAAAAAARLPRGGSGLLLTSLHRFNKQNAHSLHYCGRLYTPTKKNMRQATSSQNHLLKTAYIKIASSRTYSAWRISWYCRLYTKLFLMLALSVHRVIFSKNFLLHS